MSNEFYNEYVKDKKFAELLLKGIEDKTLSIVSTDTKVSKTRLKRFLKQMLKDIEIHMEMYKDMTVDLVDNFTDPKSDVFIGENEKGITMLTADQIVGMEEEVEEIEKFYPGDQYLTKEEKLAKAFFKSLHDYQLFISRIRQGFSSILTNPDGSLTICSTE